MAHEETGERRPPLIERVRARRERHRQRSLFVRVPFAVAGLAVFLLGVVMLFTPGPGWALIIFGLGLLALEFSWAERWLERVIDQVERASEQVKHGNPVVRAMIVAAAVVALAAAVAAVVFWDVPYFPG